MKRPGGSHDMEQSIAGAALAAMACTTGRSALARGPDRPPLDNGSVLEVMGLIFLPPLVGRNVRDRRDGDGPVKPHLNHCIRNHHSPFILFDAFPVDGYTWTVT